MLLAANPDAIIRLTVNRFISVTQGTMMTSGASPEVTADLTANPSGRVTKRSNHSFEVGGNTPGGSPLDLRIEVWPDTQYEAAGLIIRDPSNLNATADWDDPKVGHGVDAYAVTVRDKGKGGGGSPVTFELYMLIKAKGAADDQLGDYGLIDPRITNT